jgi:hypothetical protein
VDTLLNQRWQSRLLPFDGDCILTDDLISVEDLRKLLGIILPELEKSCHAQSLYAFDDWHQHDGYITGRRVADWGALAAIVRSVDTLIASRQGDTYVHRSFYSEDFSFLLRYDVSDEQNTGASGFAGTFDLSAEEDRIARILSLVPLPLRSQLRVEPSKDYFDRTYAG